MIQEWQLKQLTKMILMIDYNDSAYANTVTGNLNLLIDSKSR